MRVMITGAAGLFGHGLARVFATRHTVFPLTRADADITQAEQVHSAIAQVKPDVVIHSAAIPDLDRCEADPARAYLLHVHGTRHVVEAARSVGAGVAYVSTDAVFDGEKRTPYAESDLANPPTVYGRTKLRGEEITRSLPHHWIFRVSVLFGPGKTNFVEKGLHKVAAGEEYVVAADQLGSATCTIDAAEKIMEVIERGRKGLYHLSNVGPCTRLELARYAVEIAGLDATKVIGKPRNQMGRRATRLDYAVMEMRALEEAGLDLPRPWQEAVGDYIRTFHRSIGGQRDEVSRRPHADSLR